MNCDENSQLRYFILLPNGSIVEIRDSLKSYKEHRVFHSALCAKLITFTDIFDQFYTKAEEIFALNSDSTFLIKLYTDNKSFFNAVYKGSSKSQKRLVLDIAAPCELLRNLQIMYINFFRHRSQPRWCTGEEDD